eukprot:CAMPEP_0198695130 /NCGR_PEP_ID=MMETSP1468-20131203/282696_1 /TAXON_ID=1461545 /ORGANISM="Mantoniella sp, Strain CCMP1436" /LENGTH=129 /DNA_ID=CAMNT_0044450725 /DNA_START=39 /DNA_END=429 /DNA_ORIENTATION=-
MTKSFGQALDPHEALAVAHHHPRLCHCVERQAPDDVRAHPRVHRRRGCNVANGRRFFVSYYDTAPSQVSARELQTHPRARHVLIVMVGCCDWRSGTPVAWVRKSSCSNVRGKYAASAALAASQSASGSM